MHYCGLDVSLEVNARVHRRWPGRRVTRGVVPTTPTGLASAVSVRRAGSAGGDRSGQSDGVDCRSAAGARSKGPRGAPAQGEAHRGIEEENGSDRCAAARASVRIGGLPEPVHVPSHRSRELRGLLVARRQLVQMRTKLVNVVRGLVRQRGSNCGRGLANPEGMGQLAAANLTPALREVVAAYEATVQAVGTALGALDRPLPSGAAGSARGALGDDARRRPVCAQTLVAAVDTITGSPPRRSSCLCGAAPSVRRAERWNTPITNRRSEIRAVWSRPRTRPRRQGRSRPTPAL